MRLAVLCLLASAVFPSLSRAQAPVFEITAVDSTIKFDVKASVAIVGKFEKWDASITMTSPELSTAVLDIKIQAATVNTGKGLPWACPLTANRERQLLLLGPDTVV